MKKIFFVLSVIILSFSLSYAADNEEIIKADKLYMKGKYKESIDLFSKIQNQNQKDPKVNYNLACAYYRDGQFDKAIEHYKIASDNAQDNVFKSANLYNMGNCYYRKQETDNALKCYKECLKLNSEDIQAKHNIEFLQQEQQQNKDNKNNKNDKNKDNKDNQDKNNQQNQNNNNNNDNKDNQQNKDKNNEKDKDKDKQQNENDKNDKDKDKDNKDKQQQEQDKKKEEEKNKDKNKNQQLLDYFDKQDKQNKDNSKDAFAIRGAKSGKNW